MPGTSFESDNDDFDSQDQSEAFDEDNLQAGESNEVRTFEDLPDVEDLTQVRSDRDEDEAIALDASEFTPDAMSDADFEEDDELAYRAADEEREDDIDGQGPEDGFRDSRIAASEIEGLDEVRDADEAEGGEDDFTNFQSKDVSDDDLKAMGYADDRERPHPGRR
jgi:hypothetical protein